MANIDTNQFREYAQLEIERRRLNGRVKEINKRMAELLPTLRDQLDNARVRSVPLQGLATVGLRRSGRARVVRAGTDATEEERRRACEAIKAAGRPDLVEERFNHNTISAWLREIDRDPGQSFPPELDGAIEYVVEYELSVREARAEHEVPA